jgi:predicted enzyme related to lactoylglutathione lyase
MPAAIHERPVSGNAGTVRRLDQILETGRAPRVLWRQDVAMAGTTQSGSTSRLVALCFDARHPLRLARFWADALRWELDDGTDDEIGLVPTDGTSFRILFLPVPEQKEGKNRIHLDLTTASIDDQEETVRTLVELGARHIDIGQGPDEGHVVLADPEGNEFCVIEPYNSFLAGCGRLGSITCDGSPEVGSFWSKALGWPLVWDQDQETAIRAPDGTGPLITWGGPPLAPKSAKNRLHLDIAPPNHIDQRVEVDRLVALGATRIDIGQGDVSWVVMADPDGNEFCVLSPR